MIGIGRWFPSLSLSYTSGVAPAQTTALMRVLEKVPQSQAGPTDTVVGSDDSISLLRLLL